MPMVVWKQHGADPPELDLEHMITQRQRIADERFGVDGYKVDRIMRQIPEHFHAHARDPGWWFRRMG